MNESEFLRELADRVEKDARDAIERARLHCSRDSRTGYRSRKFLLRVGHASAALISYANQLRERAGEVPQMTPQPRSAYDHAADEMHREARYQAECYKRSNDEKHMYAVGRFAEMEQTMRLFACQGDASANEVSR